MKTLLNRIMVLRPSQMSVLPPDTREERPRVVQDGVHGRHEPIGLHVPNPDERKVRHTHAVGSVPDTLLDSESAMLWEKLCGALWASPPPRVPLSGITTSGASVARYPVTPGISRRDDAVLTTLTTSQRDGVGPHLASHQSAGRRKSSPHSISQRDEMPRRPRASRRVE